jgi:hypothetical protein
MLLTSNTDVPPFPRRFERPSGHRIDDTLMLAARVEHLHLARLLRGTLLQPVAEGEQDGGIDSATEHAKPPGRTRGQNLIHGMAGRRHGDDYAEQ